MATKNKASIILVVNLAFTILIIAFFGVLFLTKNLKYDQYEEHDFIDPNTYQSVSLTNNQLYFGHLKNISPEYLILNDVYYVRIDNDGSGQLVKLGTIESHKPQDKMVINKDQVIFWENLQFESPVVKTIQNAQIK